VIPPGNGNPIGPRWIGLNQKGYGLHGTNELHSIGQAASHGCIRLRNSEIKQLFEIVRVGDSVEIRAERDEQTAQIFAGSQEVIATAVETPIAAGQ
jgi:lipoprotein-anchoring transpeptidase ErfK/SrfK